MAPRQARSCWARRRSPSPGRGAATSMVARSSWRRGSASPPRTCCARSSWSGCSPGVATRRHVDVSEPVGPVEGRAVSRSAVSFRFKAATEAALSELLARDLGGLEAAVLMIDGLNVADQMITVALVITADGTKVPVGLVLGDTENAVVVTDLLADLVARGLRYDHGILAVLDGSKALRRAVVKVFGERALIQRCTLHKRRNVIGYLPVDERDAIDRRLALAFAQPDPAKGLKACRALARQLDVKHPDAAASLREGLEEMFTVAGLGVTGRLRRSLTNTNCIESMISITRTTTGRVKNWQDGTMKKRWIAAGMLEAERSFRRLKGHADMPSLVAAIGRTTAPAADVTPINYAQTA